MTLKFKPLLAISLTCFFLSCATGVRFTQTGPLHPPYHGPVRIFKEPPQGLAYQEIGLVSAEGPLIHLAHDMIEKMKARAAQYGANGIILLRYDRRNEPEDLEGWSHRRQDTAPDPGRPTGYIDHPDLEGAEMTGLAIRISD